jgi:hypothetical protein
VDRLEFRTISVILKDLLFLTRTPVNSKVFLFYESAIHIHAMIVNRLLIIGNQPIIVVRLIVKDSLR